MSEKSWNFLPGRWRNSPYSSSGASGLRLVWTSWRTSGRRVQMSLPRGRKSRPTRASRTLDLPLLWLPTTATWGRSMVDWLPTRAKMSWRRFTREITLEPRGEVADAAGAVVEEEETSSAMMDGSTDGRNPS